MTVKDATEVQYLNHYYEKEGSQLIVLYGQRNIGMIDLIKDFCRNKPFSYYETRPCSEREQLYLWGRELNEAGAFLPPYPAYADLFSSIIEKQSKKTVIVIQEFQNLIKVSRDFMKELITFLHSQWNSKSVMVLLCSSSIGWVENSLVQKIGEAAYEISGFMKLKEQGFLDMMRRFPESTKEQQIETYAVLGGFPKLWEHFEEGASIKDNICKNILTGGTYLYEEALRLVSVELRETNVYHAILASLAEGQVKLNDLHIHTGFSRAKVSVYLKNLMELEIVEKVFSCDTAGRENTQKGIYRIKNNYVNFYFRFVYPHLSRLELISAELFYDTYIAPTFRNYVVPYFSQFCMEYMEKQNQKGKLPFAFEKSGEWVGKVGNIDMIAQNEKNSLIGLCNWEKPLMLYEDYEWLLFCSKKAKINPDYVYLFSATRFDEKLILEAKVKKNLKLLDMDSM